MAGTQILSTRFTNVIDGADEYVIVANCTVAGTLADCNIFLLNLIDSTDPKQDTLARVIQPADTTDSYTDRDEAILAAASTWRSSSVTLTFTDIETANAAWKELSSRINALVGVVDQAAVEFVTVVAGETITYPTTDDSEKQALIDAYTASLQPILDAETARDAQAAACERLKKDLDIIEARLQEAEADLPPIQAAQLEVAAVDTSLPSLQAAISAANSQARSEVNTSAASTTEKTSIEVQHAAVDTQLVLLTAQVAAVSTAHTDINVLVTNLQTRVASHTATRNTLRLQLNTCAQATAAAEALVTAARTASDAALAAVRAACPTYTP